MMINENSMITKMTTTATWVAVEDFPVTRLCSAGRRHPRMPTSAPTSMASPEPEPEPEPRARRLR